jgi:CRP-like cAMP-binding protein
MSAGRRVLTLDPMGFAATERLNSYEIANTLLSLNRRLQKALGMRAEELEVFLVIALGTTQRFVRRPDCDPTLTTRTPLPREYAGHTSRRRIADSLGIPRETVRRHVAKLITRGMVVEDGRGRISTPGGTLELLAAQGVPMAAAQDVASLANTMLHLGGLRIGPPPL